MSNVIKRLASTMDSGLEKIFRTKYCASCVVLARKQ